MSKLLGATCCHTPHEAGVVEAAGEGESDKKARICFGKIAKTKANRHPQRSRQGSRDSHNVTISPEVLAMWREEMKEKTGPKPTGGQSSFCHNITETKGTTGTSKAYTLSRLKRESPESQVDRITVS